MKDFLLDTWDDFLDWAEEHRKIFFLIVIAVIIGVGFLIIRGVNIHKGKLELAEQERQERLAQVEAERLAQEEEARRAEEDAAWEYNSVDTGYNSQLQQRIEEGERVEMQDYTEEPVEEVDVVESTASFPINVYIYDSTGVPDEMVDHSSCKDYYANVKLSDFSTSFASKLTQDDYNSATRYLVGVTQDRNNYDRGDLQSTGWLIANLDNLNDSDAIKFTNLHVIGSLATDHVALLCCYDWYSAFGLTDTLVVFEDNSGTLLPSDFNDGDIFFATVFAHNVRVQTVNGYRVVVAEYDTY